MSTPRTDPLPQPAGHRPRRRRRPARTATGAATGAGTPAGTGNPRAGIRSPQAGTGKRAGINPTAGSEVLFDPASSAPVPAAGTSFAALGVPRPLLTVLGDLGAEHPFPIQAATLPATLAGRDVLGRGRTGSGKTIAFAIPLVARLSGQRAGRGRPRGLVLLPTRELALQVHGTVEPLARAAGLRAATVFGGVGYGPQTTALRSGVDILIACPGRLEDLIARGDCDLGDVEVTVLDEADHMADLGFLPAVRRLLRATRAGGQRMLFSATLDEAISVLVKDFLVDPAVHAVDGESSPVAAMTHRVLLVQRADRGAVIRQLAAGTGRRLLFARTKHGARKWAQTLSKNGIPAVDLHGNLSQGARERNLAAFSSGAAKVLVATDIAARGIHVDDIELVVHVDPPAEHKAYLHRSGRTARAGSGGTVVTIMLPEQRDDVRALLRKARIDPAITAVSAETDCLATVLAG
jgi:superfamily II DNA/RNA helicase